MLGARVALLVPDRVYAGDAAAFTDTATAQDLASLVDGPALDLHAYGAHLQWIRRRPVRDSRGAALSRLSAHR